MLFLLLWDNKYTREELKSNPDLIQQNREQKRHAKGPAQFWRTLPKLSVTLISLVVPVSCQGLQFLPVCLELSTGIFVVEFGQGTIDSLPGGNFLRGVLDPGDGLTTEGKNKIGFWRYEVVFFRS